MAKYFCPKCNSVTFALRYLTKQEWHMVGLQWCDSCKITRETTKCIKGLEGFAKIRR